MLKVVGLKKRKKEAKRRQKEEKKRRQEEQKKTYLFGEESAHPVIDGGRNTPVRVDNPRIARPNAEGKTVLGPDVNAENYEPRFMTPERAKLSQEVETALIKAFGRLQQATGLGPALDQGHTGGEFGEGKHRDIFRVGHAGVMGTGLRGDEVNASTLAPLELPQWNRGVEALLETGMEEPKQKALAAVEQKWHDNEGFRTMLDADGVGIDELRKELQYLEKGLPTNDLRIFNEVLNQLGDNVPTELAKNTPARDALETALQPEYEDLRRERKKGVNLSRDNTESLFNQHVRTLMESEDNTYTRKRGRGAPTTMRGIQSGLRGGYGKEFTEKELSNLVESSKKYATETVKKAKGGVIEGIKKAFRIKSPSKTAEQDGEKAGKAVAEGTRKGMKKGVKTLAQDIEANFKAIDAAIQRAGGFDKLSAKMQKEILEFEADLEKAGIQFNPRSPQGSRGKNPVGTSNNTQNKVNQQTAASTNKFKAAITSATPPVKKFGAVTKGSTNKLKTSFTGTASKVNKVWCCHY